MAAVCHDTIDEMPPKRCLVEEFLRRVSHWRTALASSTAASISSRRDFGRRAGEFHAALVAALGFHDAGLAEALEDFRQIGQGHFGEFGDLPDQHGIRTVPRQAGEGLDRVSGGEGESGHAVRFRLSRVAGPAGSWPARRPMGSGQCCEAHAAAHLIDGFVFVVFQPVAQAVDQAADVGRAVFEQAGNHLHRRWRRT